MLRSAFVGHPTLFNVCRLMYAETGDGIGLLNDESSIATRMTASTSASGNTRAATSLNANYTLAWAYGYDAGGFSAFRNYSRDGPTTHLRRTNGP